MIYELITHGGHERGFKICKCSSCGVEETCRPGFDFYTIDTDGKGPLVCKSCLMKNWRKGES